MGLLKLLAILWLIGLIMIIVAKIYTKIKVSIQINYNPESAVKTVEKGLKSEALTLGEYERQLIKIAKRTGYAGAMLKLSSLYSGEDDKEKKDETKSQFWREQAVAAGDLETIITYYGFLEYDVSSDAYSEMLRHLDTAWKVADSKEKKVLASYLKGIVNYKIGKIDAAKQNFTSALSSKLDLDSKYMIFKSLVKERNMTEAGKMLDTLENDKFEVPSEDYLTLYNYYAAKRNGNEPDYESEIKYVEKYAASKNADQEILKKIGVSTYYSFAVALQNGGCGVTKNTQKSLNAYENAAKFDSIEALYYLGEGRWTGRLLRNYYTANAYLLKAAQKGHEKSKQILDQYGIDGILIKSIGAKETVYRFFGSYELTASSSTMEWLQLYYGIQYREDLIGNSFVDIYRKKFRSFEEMVNGIHQLYTDHLTLMLKWSLTLLMSFNIDMYDAAAIIEKAGDLSLLPRIPKFEQGLENIDNRAARLKVQTAYRQATRRQWSGAGFGTTISSTINAAVKASAAAGIMNVGSGILHGIGDGIIKSMNNSEIKNMEKQLFENPNTLSEFADAILCACIDIGTIVMKIIQTHCNIILKPLEGEITFGREKLAEIDDRTLSAKISNNLSAERYDYVYALLVENLRRHPLNTDILKQITMLTIRRDHSFTGKDYESILRYAGDFRVDLTDIANALQKT